MRRNRIVAMVLFALVGAGLGGWYWRVRSAEREFNRYGGGIIDPPTPEEAGPIPPTDPRGPLETVDHEAGLSLHLARVTRTRKWIAPHWTYLWRLTALRNDESVVGIAKEWLNISMESDTGEIPVFFQQIAASPYHGFKALEPRPRDPAWEAKVFGDRQPPPHRSPADDDGLFDNGVRVAYLPAYADGGRIPFEVGPYVDMEPVQSGCMTIGAWFKPLRRRADRMARVDFDAGEVFVVTEWAQADLPLTVVPAHPDEPLFGALAPADVGPVALLAGGRVKDGTKKNWAMAGDYRFPISVAAEALPGNAPVWRQAIWGELVTPDGVLSHKAHFLWPNPNGQSYSLLDEEDGEVPIPSDHNQPDEAGRWHAPAVTILRGIKEPAPSALRVHYPVRGEIRRAHFALTDQPIRQCDGTTVFHADGRATEEKAPGDY